MISEVLIDHQPILDRTDKERFDLWKETVTQMISSLTSSDIDMETGVRLDYLIVLRSIVAHPYVLKHKSLKQILKMFKLI